eukprot:ANDGO_05990.mRNA.1 hypothetical protein
MKSSLRGVAAGECSDHCAQSAVEAIEVDKSEFPSQRSQEICFLSGILKKGIPDKRTSNSKRFSFRHHMGIMVKWHTYVKPTVRGYTRHAPRSTARSVTSSEGSSDESSATSYSTTPESSTVQPPPVSGDGMSYAIPQTAEDSPPYVEWAVDDMVDLEEFTGNFLRIAAARVRSCRMTSLWTAPLLDARQQNDMKFLLDQMDLCNSSDLDELSRLKEWLKLWEEQKGRHVFAVRNSEDMRAVVVVHADLLWLLGTRCSRGASKGISKVRFANDEACVRYLQDHMSNDGWIHCTGSDVAWDV